MQACSPSPVKAATCSAIRSPASALGAKLGVGVNNFGSGNSTPIAGGPTIASAGSTSIGLVVGPHIGYDYPLGNALSVGAEGSYLIYTQNSGFNSFNLLGALKYWF